LLRAAASRFFILRTSFFAARASSTLVTTLPSGPAAIPPCDALKTDVSEGRSRLQALGARERALRAENARLRTLLATSRVTTLASDPVG
jgi:hypothetical protein